MASEPQRPLPRVLVVEDEASVRALLGKVVEKAGGEPTFAGSLAEARARARESSFVCVVTDKNLPDGNGLELLAELRSGEPAPEVIVVTGFGNLDSAVEALRRGAFDYLTKPFELADACNRVQHAIALRALADDKEAAEAGLRNANVRLQQLLAVDLVTGLPTPGWGYEQLERELHRARHTGRPLSVFRLELSGLDALAAEGEESLRAALSAAARALKGLLRPFDAAARLSPESFLVVYPESSEEEAEALSATLGAKLRAAAAGRLPSVTVHHRRLLPPELPDRAALLAGMGHV